MHQQLGKDVMLNTEHHEKDAEAVIWRYRPTTLSNRNPCKNFENSYF